MYCTHSPSVGKLWAGEAGPEIQVNEMRPGLPSAPKGSMYCVIQHADLRPPNPAQCIVQYVCMYKCVVSRHADPDATDKT
jgi:hypothetical protein